MVALFTCFAVVFAALAYVTGMRNAQTVAGGMQGYPTIIIDAGHGGMDGGTVAADGTNEKDINLAIALKLEAVLKAAGVNTIMVRTQDVSVHDSGASTVRQVKVSDIHNRMKLFESTPNAILVSIHQNHYSGSSIHGAQVFYSKNTDTSEALANFIQKRIAVDLQKDNERKVKPSGTSIYLLYHAKATAVMVECGFLSNPQDNQNLKDDSYQNRMAFCIAGGILDFFTKTEG